MQIIYIFLFTFLLHGQVLAQLSTQKKIFTRADTLRGSLRPERTCYDVLFYELRLNLDTGQRTIAGSVEMTFKAVDDVRTLQLDLNDSFTIEKITCNNLSLPFTRECSAVFIAFPNAIKKGTQAMLHIDYLGKPKQAKNAPWDGGFVWKRDSNNKPWIGVACEGLGASSWWPCKDHNSDEPDNGVRVMCTVPSNLKCIANGKEELFFSNKNGTTTYSWLVSYPINLYNVTLNIGDYVFFKDSYKNIDGTTFPLNYYVLRENLEKAKRQFTQVKPMMQCYEKFLGPYPFPRDGYKLVETPYLGMEHQSAIAYGNQYKTGYNGNDFSRIGLDFDYIIIHETGHEWWGNSVSCADLADMWIHEGFCTYSESIYVECLFDRKKSLQYINAKKASVLNAAPIKGPYTGVNEEGDGDMYTKGSLLLNTLRTVVNSDLLW